MINGLGRSIALALRRRSDKKRVRETLAAFERQTQNMQSLPPNDGVSNRYALIRLDDIGDYLLWRNFLPFYRNAWPDAELWLIGNKVWKPLFDAFDASFADETIWIDKKQWFKDEAYKTEMLTHVREQNFARAVCPARTRPLLLDDVLALASAAPERFAAANTHLFPEWNTPSDFVYTDIFPDSKTPEHEFLFNKRFTEAICGLSIELHKPQIPVLERSTDGKIILFIGASAKSKLWPQAYWVKLTKLLLASGAQPVLAGGPGEAAAGEEIARLTGVASTVGQLNLEETVLQIASAALVISGDTMAAHLAVAADVKLLLLANGVNASRFADYEKLAPEQVKTLFTPAFASAAIKENFQAVSSDMRGLKPEVVFREAQKLLSADIAQG